MNDNDPKLKKVVEGANDLSLGISIVVAILIGIAIGIGMKKWTGETWTLWLGVVIGIGAALRNIQIAYKKQKASLDELKDDPRFRSRRFDYEDDED
ncbi:AtpZ/AtpI family protein [Nitratifractor sp.]